MCSRSACRFVITLLIELCLPTSCCIWILIQLEFSILNLRFVVLVLAKDETVSRCQFRFSNLKYFNLFYFNALFLYSFQIANHLIIVSVVPVKLYWLIFIQLNWCLNFWKLVCGPLISNEQSPRLSYSEKCFCAQWSMFKALVSVDYKFIISKFE